MRKERLNNSKLCHLGSAPNMNRSSHNRVGWPDKITSVCQHLRKGVSIWKVLAYYAGILCQHLPNRNPFSKMLA